MGQPETTPDHLWHRVCKMPAVSQLHQMKQFLVCLLFACLVCNASAQHFALGGKIGVNYSASVIKNISGFGSQNDFGDTPGFGFVFGGFMRIGIGGFLFEPELLFSDEKSYVSYDQVSLHDIFATDISKTDIPVLIGIDVFHFLRVLGGPVISNFRAESSDPLFHFENVKWGYQAGLGFDIGRFAFDGRYEGNISKIPNTVYIDGAPIHFDTQKRVLQFSLGYKIFK